jgi:hypothetical protein
LKTVITGTAAENVFDSVSENSEFSKNIWIGDGGASCHFCNDHLSLFDVRNVSERITVSNGKTMEDTFKQVYGKIFEVLLQEVKFVTEL